LHTNHGACSPTYHDSPYTTFSTKTQVNFDAERFRDYTLRADELTRGLKAQLARANIAGGPAKEPLPW
jgi:hypothetical protein